MRSDSKRLWNRVRHFIQYPRLLFPSTPDTVFPEIPSARVRLNARLYAMNNELKKRPFHYNLGSLYTIPHPVAVAAYKNFVGQNPNHLGGWSSYAPRWATYQLEYEVIQKMIDLYHAKKQRLEGYITSGGTEGNLYALWLGVTSLERWCTREAMALLTTSLSHYSIDKTARICGIRRYIVPLDHKAWNMHPDGLHAAVQRLYKQGVRGFLLPLTIGYTSTGTSDDVVKIAALAQRLQTKFRGSHFYIWTDAASDGFTEPFLNPNFSPFRSPLIQAVITDFHKFGMVPYSAGMVLYRKSLKHLIEKPVSYFPQKDNTIAGSRPGAPAASIWAMIHFLGKRGYRTIFQKQLSLKQYCMQQLTQDDKTTHIITSSYSLTCGVMFGGPRGRKLSSAIENKYWLYPEKMSLCIYPNRKTRVLLYKFHFLPHVSGKVVKEFLADVQRNKLYPTPATQ